MNIQYFFLFYSKIKKVNQSSKNPIFFQVMYDYMISPKKLRVKIKICVIENQKSKISNLKKKLKCSSHKYMKSNINSNN